MSLLERLNNDMKQAMKNKEKDKLSVIRMLKAALQNEELKLRHELTDEDELTVLSRELKQRKDSLEEFAKQIVRISWIKSASKLNSLRIICLSNFQQKKFLKL